MDQKIEQHRKELDDPKYWVDKYGFSWRDAKEIART